MEKQYGQRSSLPSLIDMSLLPEKSEMDKTVKFAHIVYDHLIALWANAIIETAYELGIFNTLAEEPINSLSLANVLEVDPQGMRIILDALYAYGFIERTETAQKTHLYFLSQEMQRCLLPGELYSLAGKIIYDRRTAWDAWRNLSQTVHNGCINDVETHNQNQISDFDYEELVKGINFWAPPTITELCRGLRDLGWDTNKAVSVLDVGCGTGLYSQLLLQEFPHWTATGIDRERIAPLARAQSVRIGVADRFTCRVSDFWEGDWGQDFNLILFTNIFHLQNTESAQLLMKLAAQSLVADGIICIVDHILDDDRSADSPQSRFALLFAASMFATGGGDTYSLSDYDSWLDNVGLQRLCVLAAPMHRILIATHAM